MTKLKQKRSLSGIYFRFKNPETNKMENRCFEDLPESEQDRRMKGRKEQWLQSLAKQLADKLNIVGEMTNLTAEDDDE